MPKNISTKFDEFVNETIKTKKVNKIDINNGVLDCLSKSDKKLSISEISKITGFKNDNIYISLVENKEVKSKKVKDVLYWYISENQSDPVKKVTVVANRTVDDVFYKNWQDDIKNNPNKRTIFLTMDEQMKYVQSQMVGGKIVARKPRAKATARRKK